MNKVEKIIFLDIDGVLNHERFFKERYNKQNDALKREYPLSEIDFNSVKLLNQLTSETDAKIVLSSTWRMGKSLESLKELFNDAGISGELIGKTDVLPREYALRGNEILKWIKDNKDLIKKDYHSYKNYVILDDDSDMLYWQRNNFILVDRFVGITEGTLFKAKKILNQE